MARYAEKNPLATALVLSLVIHCLVFGLWKAGSHYDWWKHHPDWITALTRWVAKVHRPLIPRIQSRQQPQPAAQEKVIPMTFVEVDPETVTTEAPKDAIHYSSKNSKAANPDVNLDREIPKVDGTQDKVTRLMDNEKPKPFPLQPSAPAQPKPEELAPAPPKPTPGDLALKVDAPKPRERPRTLAAARAQKGILTGEKMKQDGGVRSPGRISFNVKATPFGDYDAAFIAAVEQRWHDLLFDHQGTQRSGRVIIDFKLNSDGRITDLSVQGNDVGEILGMMCQRAILDPAPYQKWPGDMRRTIGSNTREIRFTFYYN